MDCELRPKRSRKCSTSRVFSLLAALSKVCGRSLSRAYWCSHHLQFDCQPVVFASHVLDVGVVGKGLLLASFLIVRRHLGASNLITCSVVTGKRGVPPVFLATPPAALSPSPTCWIILESQSYSSISFAACGHVHGSPPNSTLRRSSPACPIAAVPP